MAKRYQIIDWQQTFENNRSRQIEKCSFVCLPNKQGLGLSMLLAEPNGHAMFGVFVLIVEKCSQHRATRDGWLTVDGRESSRAWSAQDVAVIARCGRDLAQQTLDTLCSDGIGWMRALDSLDSLQGADSPVSPQQGPAESRTNGPSSAHNSNAESNLRTLPEKVTPERRSTDAQVTPERRPSDVEGMNEGMNGKKEKRAPASRASAGSDEVPEFVAFWGRYPKRRRHSKDECLKLWKSKGLSGKAADIMAGLERWLLSEDWKKQDGQFIGNPLTWLRQAKWEAFPVPACPSDEDDDYGADPDETLAQLKAMREREPLPETLVKLPSPLAGGAR